MFLALITMVAALGRFQCGADAVLEKYKTQSTQHLLQSYRLQSTSAATQVTAHLSELRLAVARQERGSSEEWYTDPVESTHRFANGFLGRAGPTRHKVDRALVGVLTGAVLQTPIEHIACRRQNSLNYTSVTFRWDRDTSVVVELDDRVSRPVSAVASNRFGSDEISGIRYAFVDDTIVPIAWTRGQRSFSFSSVQREQILPHPTIEITSGPVILEQLIELYRLEPNSERTAVRVIINGIDAYFLLDTGNGFTAISSLLADKIKVQRSGQSVFRVAAGYEKLPVGVVRSLNIGQLRLVDQPVAITPNVFGYDGAIGLALFANRKVVFEKSAVRLLASEGDAGEGRQIDTFDGIPTIDADVDGVHSQVLLDTGLSLPGLFSGRSAGLVRRAEIPGLSCGGLGLANWQRVNSRFISNMRIFGKSYSLRSCVTEYDLGPRDFFNGVLGAGFIFQHVRSIDYATGRLELH